MGKGTSLKGTDPGFDVAKGILRALADVGTDNSEFHERLREEGKDPTEYLQKLNDVVQDEGVVRAFEQMLLSRPVSSTEVEHKFEALDSEGGMSSTLAQCMLAAESARSAVHFKRREPARQKAVGRTDRRRGGGSTKR